MSDANVPTSVTVRPLPLPRDERPTTPLLTRALRLIIDHNPFFLLSGVCMLAGCYLINSALHEMQMQERLDVLLGLLGVFNVYEVTVIGLAWYLLHRRGLLRHAGWLLMLELLLLVDATLLYQEVAIASGWAGLIVSVTGFAWILLKLAAICTIARLRLTRWAWCVIGLQLLAILGMPVLWRALAASEVLQPRIMLLFWWLGGALLALTALPPTWWTSDTGPVGMPGLRRALGGAVIVLPTLSVLGHLWAGLYVYDLSLDRVHLAPLVLGLAALLMRVTLDRWQPASVRRAVMACVGVALLLSLGSAGPWAIPLGAWLIVSPLRLTLLCASAMAVLLWCNVGGRWLLAIAPLLALSPVLGHDPASMAATLHHWRHLLAQWQSDLRPRSTFAWGVLTVSLAFVFLGCGTLLSLFKRQDPPATAG